MKYKPTKEMVADVLTKPVQGALQRDLSSQLRGEMANSSEDREPCIAGACRDVYSLSSPLQDSCDLKG